MARARVVKRISSTRTRKRPKTEAKRAVSETVEFMPKAVNNTAPVVVPTESGGRQSVDTRPVANEPVAGRIVLGAACTIHEAQALRAHLLERAAHPGPYEIDGGGVEQIDTAGLQLVVAFALDCLERNVHYVWKARSPVLDEAIRVLGVGALLESPGASMFGGAT
jgi:phospholipid transport system transporter-binding protein